MLPQIFDTHAHLNLKEFADDWRQVAADSLERGVFVINIGVNYPSSERAVAIAREYGRGLWAAIGLHPENILVGAPQNRDHCIPENIPETDFNADAYRRLARSSDKVVAIGEIGLDYLRLPKDKEKSGAIKTKQKKVFCRQLALARELDLPVIIHSRLAHEDIIAILENEAKANGPVRGAVHCFTGTAADAARYYDLGFYFGLNGIIFKRDINDAIARMPLDRILLETDCPYLLPPLADIASGGPLSQIKRNEPRYVVNVAQRVAQIRNEPVETVIAAATGNTQALFGVEIDQSGL